MKRYKFLRFVRGKIKSENGSPPCYWKIGEWKKCDKNLRLCNDGFHCSKKPLDALRWVAGEILAIVETKGDVIKDTDKECWSNMRILKVYKWTKKDSVALSIYSAELVLKNYEKIYPDDDRPRKAIEAAKRVLEHDTAKNRSAAWSAESAAESAAWSARSARSAESAARSAGSAALNKINKWIIDHIKELKEIKE